jgi:hypothetical protein
MNKENFQGFVSLFLYRINLKELGNDEVGGDGYRFIRPYNCDCWGTLSPEEEME